MANVQYWDFSWVSAEGDEMAPGDTHYWISYPYSYGDVVDLMAHAVYGDPTAPDRELIVENIHTAVDPQGQRTIVFNVRNVGTSDIIGYLCGVSIINQ
jgi:hypothetical protein